MAIPLMIIKDIACKPIKFFIVFWKWFFSLNDREKKANNSLEKLQTSMRMTAKCRYNAASRLICHSKFAFFTTTFLSLGLIFIPLLSNSGIKLAFGANVLNMLQIFLAVAILVYSVVIGTSRYDVRAEKLTQCGDKLKILIRSVEQYREDNQEYSKEELESYQEQYSNITSDSENHGRTDYWLAILEMDRDYFYTGLPRLKLYFISKVSQMLSYILPTLMLLTEIIFITDMVGATEIFSPYLNGNAVVSHH